ncbi:methyl-accepting chemotaxis protein [Chlorogloeopsis fritschii PCC 9212]|nr:methyl-accepting chemotaxis protein [Chlorogloeopsis fritschii]
MCFLGILNIKQYVKLPIKQLTGFINHMFKNLSFQWRMISAFLFMGLLLLIVAVVGWSGTSRLSNHINTLSIINLPSVDGLWKVNEGETQVQSAERLLMNPTITLQQRQEELSRIKAAWEQIEEGFRQYEATPVNNKQEEEIYKKFRLTWDAWKQAHQYLRQLQEKYTSVGIFHPWKYQIELMQQEKENSSEMARVKTALAIYAEMSEYMRNEEIPLYKKAEDSLLTVLQENQEFAADITKAANKDVSQSTFWVAIGMLIGPLTAIALGIMFSRQIANQIICVVKVAEQISMGNLTAQVNGDSSGKDEISRLFNACKTMIKNLNALIRQVQKSGAQIITSTMQIATSGKQLEATITEQVASTKEVAAAAREISTTSKELVKTMEEVAVMSQATTTAATKSQKDLLQMEMTIRQLTEATNSIAARLGVISEKANNINNIVITITKVADQTNLLSLNAAIEAEKAGEYGLGFAVVAREIRRLADQTAVATLDIEQMVKQMQSSVSTGVMEMDKFAKEVGRTVEDVARISSQTTQIIEQVQHLTPRFEEVNQGMEIQSQGALQISEAMTQLSSTSVQTADSLREINHAIAQLNQVAQGLHQEISRFQVNGDDFSSVPLIPQLS